jgi:hypothetical protein
MEECLLGLEVRVTSAMNEQLLRTFVASELDVALSQMQPLNSPEPNGFTASFYQRLWGTVWEEVCTTILAFLNNGVFV